jgi:hypothetical protein
METGKKIQALEVGTLQEALMLHHDKILERMFRPSSLVKSLESEKDSSKLPSPKSEDTPRLVELES